MTKTDKLRKKFLSKPKDFTWGELKVLLNGGVIVNIMPVRQADRAFDLFMNAIVILCCTSHIQIQN